jgi:AcrR family transcriptional regulator
VAQTQEQRRVETRRRLLEAARTVVAERGVTGATVEAMATAADRTSGAIYDHFDGKDGLIVALLDQWKDAATAATLDDLAHAQSPTEKLGSVWANFAAPRSEDGDQWVLLEHELWLYACRQSEAHDIAAGRYSEIRARLAQGLAEGMLGDGSDPAPAEAEAAATLMIGLMIGLEMQRRLDPAAVPDRLAVLGLRALAAIGELTGEGP